MNQPLILKKFFNGDFKFYNVPEQNSYQKRIEREREEERRKIETYFEVIPKKHSNNEESRAASVTLVNEVKLLRKLLYRGTI